MAWAIPERRDEPLPATRLELQRREANDSPLLPFELVSAETVPGGEELDSAAQFVSVRRTPLDRQDAPALLLLDSVETALVT